MSLKARDCREREGIVGSGSNPAQKFDGQKGQVDGQEKIQVGAGCRQSGFDPRKRTRAGIVVRDDWSVLRQIMAVADDGGGESHPAQLGKRMLDKRTPLKFDEGFIPTHPSASAASENEG